MSKSEVKLHLDSKAVTRLARSKWELNENVLGSSSPIVIPQ